MSTPATIDLQALSECLPVGMTPEWIRNKLDSELWQRMPQLAVVHFMVSHNFDLEDYLERYPDVKENKVDPVWHFLIHGINEHRNMRLKGEKYLDSAIKQSVLLSQGKKASSELTNDSEDVKKYRAERDQALEELAIAHLKAQWLRDLS